VWLALGRSGVLPQKLVWDREAAIAGHGRPTSEFAAFCGQLKVGWVRRGARQDATDARSFPGHRPADGGAGGTAAVSPGRSQRLLRRSALRSLKGDSYRPRGKELDARPAARLPEIG